MNCFTDNLDIYTDTEEMVGQASKIGKKCNGRRIQANVEHT